MRRKQVPFVWGECAHPCRCGCKQPCMLALKHTGRHSYRFKHASARYWHSHAPNSASVIAVPVRDLPSTAECLENPMIASQKLDDLGVPVHTPDFPDAPNAIEVGNKCAPEPQT